MVKSVLMYFIILIQFWFHATPHWSGKRPIRTRVCGKPPRSQPECLGEERQSSLQQLVRRLESGSGTICVREDLVSWLHFQNIMINGGKMYSINHGIKTFQWINLVYLVWLPRSRNWGRKKKSPKHVQNWSSSWRTKHFFQTLGSWAKELSKHYIL